eukprot:scaffold17342_cov31-Prasinocladus_malaysianus.AAC.2
MADLVFGQLPHELGGKDCDVGAETVLLDAVRVKHVHDGPDAAQPADGLLPGDLGRQAAEHAHQVRLELVVALDLPTKSTLTP